MYSGEMGFQTGDGLSGINIYRGPLHRQSGAGLGNFFSAAVRYLRPLLSSGINALTSQGVATAGSVLSQLGKKDLQTILNEEGGKALKNLSEKALNKLNQKRGEPSETQVGSGRVSLFPYQLPKIPRRDNTIKGKAKTTRTQTSRRRKIGTTIAIKQKKRQIGRGKKSKKGSVKRKSKCQIGSGRKIRKRKSKVNKTKKRVSKDRSLDIFD